MPGNISVRLDRSVRRK